MRFLVKSQYFEIVQGRVQTQQLDFIIVRTVLRTVPPSSKNLRKLQRLTNSLTLVLYVRYKDGTPPPPKKSKKSYKD